MTTLLDETQPLPFEPGKGPFRIKGVAYLGHLDYVEKKAPGGVAAMLKGFRDPALAEFFQQRFLPASWYDIIPLVVSGHVCARQCSVPFSQFLRARSKFQAELDISGIHRFLLKLASPAMVITRLPALQSQYIDFHGRGEAQMIAPGHAILSRAQLPQMFGRWFSVVNDTYAEAVITTAGGQNVLIRSDISMPDKMVHGVPTVQFRCEVRWD